MGRCLAIFLCSIVVWLPATSLAVRWQTLADSVFQHIGKEQGLPHPVVNAMVQDQVGFVWFATEYGVGRWDGYRMRVYQNEPQNPRSLPGNYVRCLFVDQQGRLWLGSQGSGLARYDPETDDFVTISVGKNGLSNQNVNALADDGHGGVWVASDGGLDHIEANGKIRQFRHDARDANSLPVNLVHSLLRDRDGWLWIGTERGLVRQAAQGFLPITLEGSDGLSAVRSLMQASDGAIWIGTTNDGAWVLPPRQLAGVAHPALENTRHAPELTRSLIYAMVEVAPGHIWLGTAGHGILAFDQHRAELLVIRHDPILPGSLSNNVVLNFFRDRSGLIWVGSQRGVNRYDPAQAALLTLFGPSSRANGLADADVRSIWEESPQRVWLGLGNRGVDIFDVNEGRVAALRPDGNDPQHHLQQQRVEAIAPGPDGMVYLATAMGLYRSDRAASKLERVENNFRKPEASVSSLLLRGQQLWVGGTGDGLWLVERDGKMRRPNDVAWANQLHVSIMLPVGDEAIWVGTWGGLFWFHPASGKVEAVPTDARDPTQLHTSLISTLLLDRSGRLWVGTSGGGLYVGRGRSADGKWQFRRIGSSEGLHNQNVNKLLEDTSGTIWASTDDGIVRVDPVSLTVQSMHHAENASINAYWAGSGILTSGGELLYGGLGGLSVLKPDLVQRWTYQAPVVLTDLRVGGKSVGVQRFNLAGQSPVLTIAPDANHLAVEFAALDYSVPEKNRYQFLLEGVDADWNTTDPSRRLATYANLAPGQYRLHLRGYNRSGLLGPIRTLSFEVLPAWYQTWWFKVSATLASFSLALLLFGVMLKRRTRLLHQYQQQLQQLVDQRTSQLQAIQSELLAANHDLNHVNDDLAVWGDTLRHLSEVGQDITAKLDVASVAAVLQRHVQGLLNAAQVALYRLDADGKSLLLAPMPGQDPGDFSPLPLDGDAPAVQVALQQHETLIARAVLSGSGAACETLFVPLLIDHRLLGVMAIESRPNEGYGERERLIFRTLCAYGAIALDNAEAYRQVAATLKTLSDTQAQLVQQAKIASLGTLTAGVAHEINNPANFAYVGSYNLGQQLKQFHQFLLDLAGPEAPPELLASLQQRFDQLGESLSAISEGATRIRDLVRDLRTFSRLDEADWKEVAIGDSLNATVNLVRMQYAHQVQIECDLQANPVLTCWPAQLNQVFMNLIVNACQAIASRPEARKAAEPGRLAIRSLIQEPWLVLEFDDNGGGMSDTTLQRIFDPFYTTKGVGEGMGMGLSIVLSIIEKHQGQIDVQSTVGQGSRFVLKLPLVMK